jgi:hypothetical protein
VGDGRHDRRPVPSAVIEAEWNYLWNPAHQDFTHLKVGDRETLEFDPRFIT